jgi:radical SAM superfamily enzyme YgiQ (UPF0313 family)
MKVKMILPALTEATSPLFRPVKYSLFPPLGLATLAAYLAPEDEVTLVDEHVEKLKLDDAPELVVIQVYITSAHRSYAIADHYRRQGAFVVLGGLHVTSLPEEAAAHADAIFLGPGEDTWPQFLKDFRNHRPLRRYESRVRTLADVPPIRRDLIKRHLYLVPNSIVVSRGCPHVCDFCYKEAFFTGGRSFYTQTVDAALAEIDRLPGRHLYFLDDHLFGNPKFAAALFDGMRGMRRLWQAAGTVNSVMTPGLLEKAVACGLRSLFVGFETISAENLAEQRKFQNLRREFLVRNKIQNRNASPANGGQQNQAPQTSPPLQLVNVQQNGGMRDYGAVIRRLHDNGVMVNGSFVFGMDGDDPSVFDRTIAWAVEQGIETATFHILTPYPSTALYERMAAAGRLAHSNWDLYDTRHVVFKPAKMSPAQLEAGYWRAYKDFYRWGNIVRGAWSKEELVPRLRHLAYATGWKKFEFLWDLIIRAKQVTRMLPLLETILDEFRRKESGKTGERRGAAISEIALGAIQE